MTKVTIYSIADALGVSGSTVSRAFTRPDQVRDDVRARILAKADEMGYQPNKSARRLATGRTGAIGLFIPDITNPFFPPLVRAIQQAAADKDASVIMVDAGESTSAEAALIRRLAGQVDGVIVASPRGTPARLREAIGSTPAIVVNREMMHATTVICDNSAALAQAGDHLRDLNHQTVALLHGPSASWAARQRASAIRKWAGSADVELIELGPFEASYEGGREGAAAFADSPATAAFAFDDLTACGVVAGLAERGLSVPGDRSIVGCDDVLLARVLTPKLSTVSAPIDRLGAAAVDLLGEVMAGKHPNSLRIQGDFTPRQSSGPAPTP